jgi:hypothetical protein
MNVPYSPIATGRDMSQRMYPEAYQDYGIRPPGAPGMGAGPANFANVQSGVTSTEALAPTQPMQPASGGPPKYGEFLTMMEQRKGARLDENDLLTARELYSSNVLVQENLRRGAKEFQLKHIVAGFEANAGQIEQQYLMSGEPAPGATGTPDKYGNTGWGETLASFVGGAVNTLGPGALALVDQGIRAAPAMGLYNLATGGDRPGILGRTAADLSEGVNTAVDQYRTFETEVAEQAQAEKFKEVSQDEDATVSDWIGAALSGGPRVLRRQIAGVLGGMAPGIGAVSKARTIIDQLPKAAQRLTRAFALGGPQSAASVNNWEIENVERPITEFGAEVQQASRDMQELGMPVEEADRRAKQVATSAARPLVLLATYAANVGLASLPGMGTAERLITRSGAPGNVVGRVIGSAAEETAEEAAAGALEQFGINAGRAYTGQQVPLNQGVAQAAAQGGVLGGIVGGGSGLIPQPEARTVQPPATPATATLPPGPAPTPGVGAPPPAAPAATPPTGAPTGPAGIPGFAAGPGIEETALDTAKKKIADTLTTKLAPRTSAFRKAVASMDAQGLLQAAQAQAAALAGDSWQQMSSLQKLEAVETAVEVLNKTAKVKGPELTGELESIRALINGPTPAPVTATPLPAEVTGTPTTGKKKPLRNVPQPPAPTTPAATAATATDPEFDSLTPGDKLSAAEGMVTAWNAANPTKPVTIGAVVTALTPDKTKGKTVSQLAATLGTLSAPAATPAGTASTKGKPLRNPVPKPPAPAAAPTPGVPTVDPLAIEIEKMKRLMTPEELAAFTAATTPAPTPAAPTPAPAATTPAPTARVGTVDAVNNIIAAHSVEIRSDIIDAVNASKKAGNNIAVDVALRKHGLTGDAATAIRKLTGVQTYPAPASVAKAEPAKTEAPKTETPAKKPLRKPVPKPPATTEAAKPADLDAAKPHTSVGAKRYTLEFENDIDKAMYLLSGKDKWTKADAEYVDFVTKSLGINKNEAQFEAQQLRNRVRDLAAAQAKNAKDTSKTVKVPSGVTQSPKPQAPAGAGAEGSSAKPVNKTETISEAVSRITNNELAASEEAELVDAVKLGRESGDPGPISAAIKQLEEDGAEFTADQKRELRELATPQATREPTVENAPEPTPTTSSDGIEVTELPATVEDEPSSPLETNSEVPELRTEIVAAIKDLPPAKRTGAMLDIIAKSKHSTKFQKWLARKLAPMMEKMDIQLTIGKHAKSKHGSFSTGPNGRKLIINTVRPSTILHEVMHAVTIHAMNGSLRVNGSLDQSKYLEQKWKQLHSYAKTYVKNNPSLLDGMGEVQRNRVKNAFKNKEEIVTYAFTDATVRQLFSQIPASEPTKYSNLWAEFKTLLVDWYATIFNMNLAQRSFLDQVLELGALTAETTSGAVDAEGVSSFKDVNTDIEAALIDLESALEPDEWFDSDTVGPSEPSTKKIPITLKPVTAAQRIWELFSVASLGIEKAMQDVIRNGGNVLAEYNPYYAMRKYTSDLAEMKNIDNLEVVEPVRNWLTKNWRRFGSKDSAEFRKDLDKFLQTFHMLTERAPSIWAETVPLEAGAELTRAELIDDAYAGNLTSEQLADQLLSLANRHAKVKFDQWTEDTKLTKSSTAMRKTLADLKKKGFDETTLAELNTLLKEVRDRRLTRLIDSGRVDSGDPFLTRNWKWYVPLKGHLSVSEDAADYDIGTQRGETKAFRNTNMKVLEGRQSNANNALTQLVEDMNNAATAAAEGEFTSKLFEFAVLDAKNKEILGAKYQRFFGTPKSGYYTMIKKVDKKTGKVKYVPSKIRYELNQPKSGFIYHNGNEHYIVYLPNDSQLNRGVSGLRRVTTPTVLKEGALLEKPLQAVGTVTNIMARAYTTWHPIWQLMVGFLRDTTTLPTTVAATVFDSPLKATGFGTKYAANLAKNTLELSRLPSTWASVWGDRAKLREYIKQNPDSLFARISAYRDAGGSTEFAQGLNKDRADDLLFGRLEMTPGKWLARGYHGWNDATSNWAALLENVGRVSAWEALVAEGKSPYEAAVIAKSALDYGQSGEWGRMINLWHAFFRVGATSLDVMRRAFTTPTGEVDKVKIGKWAPFFGAMGVAAYSLQAMLLGDDEDGEERIKKMDANTLTQRVLFPGSDDDVNSYPIGLGLPQLLMTPGILGAAWANGHISAAEARDAYYQVLLRNATPVQPLGRKPEGGPLAFATSWGLGLLVGTPLRPGVEVTANTNAFGNVVHTEWLDKGKYKADQGMPATGEEWKDIAGFMRDIGIDMFPEDWAHISRGYGGQVASEIVRWTIDKDKREMEGVDSSAIRTSLRLAVTDEDFYYRNEARDVKDQLNISRRRLSAATEDGERESRWLSQHPADRRRIAEWKALDKAQDTYYQEIARIRDNRLLSAEGRRLQKKRADARLREAVNRAQRVIDATAD